MKQVQIGSYILKDDVLDLGEQNWNKFREWLKEQGFSIHDSMGNYRAAWGLDDSYCAVIKEPHFLWKNKSFGKYQLTAQDILEIINPKEEIKMKKDWSIKVNSKEQGEMYKKVLIALGYNFGGIENPTEVFMIRHGSRPVGTINVDCMWFSALGAATNHFNSLEDFLMWHFQPELTEQQKKIKELEETINKAQKQIQELKGL